MRATNANYNLVGACNLVNPNAQPGMLGNPVRSGRGFNGMINSIFITSGSSGCQVANALLGSATGER